MLSTKKSVEKNIKAIFKIFLNDAKANFYNDLKLNNINLFALIYK